jgi:hypothetical protein
MPAANDNENVPFLTIRSDEILDEAQRAAVDETVVRNGGTARWRTSPRAQTTYGLVELPPGASETAFGAAGAAGFAAVTLSERAIIALAVFPAVPEALPQLLEAFAGAGRPAGILRSRECPGGIVLEWDPERTKAAVVLGLVDVELHRFASARTAELLAPLPETALAGLAAGGLQAADVDSDRILETLLERAGLHA